jgi:hypothetical protein
MIQKNQQQQQAVTRIMNLITSFDTVLLALLCIFQRPYILLQIYPINGCRSMNFAIKTSHIFYFLTLINVPLFQLFLLFPIINTTTAQQKMFLFGSERKKEEKREKYVPKDLI